MKIIIEDDEKTLNEIILTDLQTKALLFANEDAAAYLVNKINRILDFALEQAKQIFSKHEIDKKTDVELEVIADEIEAEKVISEEPEEVLEEL